jgi:hypothetical protein
MSKDIIGDSLGIEEISIEDINPTDIIPAAKPYIQKTKSTIDDDFEYARGNLLAVIEKGQQALDGILDVADMSQNPRSYEVVATIMKTLSDAQKDLLELQQRKQKLTGEAAATNQTVNNNLFVGSTAELQKLLKQASQENEE